MKREYPKQKRCPRCIVHPSNWSNKKDYHPAMQRMYIRICSSEDCHSFSQIGWFCRKCGKMMQLRKMDCKGEIR